MQTHELKIWTEHIEALASKRKTFEIRSTADRAFEAGDVLLLNEYLPEDKVYTGRQVRAVVSMVHSDVPGLEKGFALLSLAEVTKTGKQWIVTTNEAIVEKIIGTYQEGEKYWQDLDARKDEVEASIKGFHTVAVDAVASEMENIPEAVKKRIGAAKEYWSPILQIFHDAVEESNVRCEQMLRSRGDLNAPAPSTPAGWLRLEPGALTLPGEQTRIWNDAWQIEGVSGSQHYAVNRMVIVPSRLVPWGEGYMAVLFDEHMEDDEGYLQETETNAAGWYKMSCILPKRRSEVPIRRKLKRLRGAEGLAEKVQEIQGSKP